ncbi:hypothetical protein [Polaromonas sp. AET17H-212]|uniref:hypothetical protein n=1 Tax=Polaromonas sp. AET17H-212 TaxID=1977061 RepID=UPI00114168BC|nr:hypothetical protein [Polaromonas sp. AET17H-212]
MTTSPSGPLLPSLGTYEEFTRHRDAQIRQLRRSTIEALLLEYATPPRVTKQRHKTPFSHGNPQANHEKQRIKILSPMTHPQQGNTPRAQKNGGKQNAHMKWAFATSLDGLGVGCAGKI